MESAYLMALWTQLTCFCILISSSRIPIFEFGTYPTNLVKIQLLSDFIQRFPNQHVIHVSMLFPLWVTIQTVKILSKPLIFIYLHGGKHVHKIEFLQPIPKPPGL